MIDEYLGDLDRRLHGCGRFKADLLGEARDGLHDAADAYRAGGWTDEDAERRAVADFGPAAVVARDYQAELGMLSGVRTLWKLVIGVPAMQIAWDYARILTFGEWTQLSTPTPEWYKVVTHVSHGARVRRAGDRRARAARHPLAEPAARRRRARPVLRHARSRWRSA